ncbi:MAG TPA: EAL domain-containing protein [Baekduia sp.]|nr:EAL domain-containing protein [Baekduia sp.]
MSLHHAPTSDAEWAELLGPAADVTTEGLIVQDRTGIVRAANLAARAIAGLGDRPLEGHGPHDPGFRPRHADGRPMAPDEQPAMRVLATGEAQRNVLMRLELRRGEERWITVNAVPLLAEQVDEPYGVVASFIDVTAFVEAQAALADRERELALLASHAGDLIARHGPDGRIISAAGGSEALLGVPPKHLKGFWAADVCHPDDAEALRRSHELAREGASNVVTYRVRHLQDGRELWLESTVQPVFDEDGSFLEAVSTTRDISARKDGEHQLRLAEERARAAAEEARRQHALLEEAQAMAHLGSWSWDVETGTIWWSDGLYRVFGIEHDGREPTVAMHEDLIHPEDVEGVRGALVGAARDGQPFDVTYRLRRPDGAQRVIHGRCAPADRVDGRVRRVWGTTQDVTDLHRLQASRREAERRFRAAFEHAPIGVCVIGLRGSGVGRWLDANPAMAELLGWEREELLGQRLRPFQHPEELDENRATLLALAAGEVERVVQERRLVHRDGRVVWTLTSAAAVRGEDGRPAIAVLQSIDITERKRFEGQLQHLADHDALTGLYNRRRFEEELDRTLAEAERYGRSGAVLVLDLDGFKYVNDTLGHHVGDELIARLAGTLRAELRETDVIARLGGDEFGVILQEADGDQAGQVAGKLLRAVERDGVVADALRHARVTASVGLALFDGGDGLSAEELLVEADIAMYDAKDGGRNRAAVHTRDEAGPGRHVSRLSWLERIREALEEDRFELHAQPIIPLGSDADAGAAPTFELLLRMRSDADELIPPATFLPIAERFDLIQSIDRWVVEHAVDTLRARHEAGQAVVLSVNLSGRTIGDGAFGDWLDELLGRRPVPDGSLIVEITETAAIVNLDRARTLAEMLRRRGCRLALDDFGTGFASFAYLKHLRFDVLKIDGEFVRGLRDNPTDRLVVEAVVAIARGLGTPSLAEFVADDDTLTAVRELGIDYAQGFHLGRPLPLDAAFAAATAGSAGQVS